MGVGVRLRVGLYKCMRVGEGVGRSPGGAMRMSTSPQSLAPRRYEPHTFKSEAVVEIR